MIACGILGLVASLYLTPMPVKTHERNVLLDVFKVFEKMSDSKKRISGFVSFLIVIAIWTAFILSFVCYLRSAIAAKNLAVLESFLNSS